eukprot:TRINITY_DN55478_c0_g1_i1.p1 TRINITY_DN55478_c0_g1~~TRINITY_DN55478_c0_g1_i1.p1  ORF type:complete len:457 (-),score=40.10 TRINITY_DN55478_c0_g1_i1:441-1811(-)
MPSADFKVVDVGGNEFVVPNDFEFCKHIRGTFSSVCSFRNSATLEKVVVKKISAAFADVVDAATFARQIKLRIALQHDCVLGIRDLYLPEHRDYQDVFVVTELMSVDLHHVIQSRQALREEHFQHITYCILCALQYLHKSQVVHRDVKPSHILLNTNDDVKLSGFSSARCVVVGDDDNGENGSLTEYVTTRWYRAPEVILSNGRYTFALDIWSLGCTLAELFGRRAIFPGKTYLDQIEKIIQIRGCPADSELDWLPPAPCPARAFLAKWEQTTKQPLESLYPQISHIGLDALDTMLQFHPARRSTAEFAMQHPFFAVVYDPQDVRTDVLELSALRLDVARSTPRSSQRALLAESYRLNSERAIPLRAVSLRLASREDNGSVTLHCHGIDGEMLTSIQLGPGEGLRVLRRKLCEELEEVEDLLRIVAADGSLHCHGINEHDDSIDALLEHSCGEQQS